MITDSQTNFVYLADTLQIKYPEFAKRLTEAFNYSKVEYDFLPHTNDVWAVDYMPIQVSKNKFIQFTYKPDYLMNKTYKSSISDVTAICERIKVTPILSNLIIDGGNVIRGEKFAILTEKIYWENKKIAKSQIDNELMELLEIDKLIIIPWDLHDWLGHSDGAVRRISETQLIINDLKNKKSQDHQNLIKAIEKSGFTWCYLPSDFCDNMNDDDATGLYLNYLEMESHVFVPIYNRPKDDEALNVLSNCFPSKTIVPIVSNDIAQSTGVINCSTWNILR
jgi:agmatine deiminase